MSDDTKFSVLCSLFNWMQRSKSSAKKRSKFRKFLDTFCKSNDYFSAMRLILPNLDRERGSYGLKESVLANCLIDALGMSKDSEDALRLINWRKGGAKIGASAGNFSLVAAEVLQRRQGMASGGLTIKELNDLLDHLASSENRAEKASVLSTLINKTNAQEMKWIVMIILKDLKLGISEKSIFHEFHPDAEDLFNVTCDLKLVCEKLRDRSQRHKRQDIEVGKAVRPQLAMRVGSAAAAWKKLQGKEVVVECKFDGDRIQIHKNGTEIHFYSRNFFDHSEYGHAMSKVISQNILVDRCILDGEMLVWDTSLNRFAEFGSNQEIAKAAKEGLDSDRQLCYFVNAPSTHSIDTLHKMVVENGGTFSMNLNNSVTHCVAAESKGIKYQAAKHRGDVIHYSWVLDCCTQRKLLHLQPKHFLFLSDSSKKKLQEEIDEFSDSYYLDLDIADIKQLLSNMDRSEDYQTVEYYKQKYCPEDKWSRFQDCCIYFHLSIQSPNVDRKVVLQLTLKRMKVEVSMGGGRVSNDLSHATHLVVLSVPGYDVNFETILKSFSMAEKHLLFNKRLHIVGSQWFEDCLKDQRLQEDAYSLKLNDPDELNILKCKYGVDLDAPSSLDENQNISSNIDGRLRSKQLVKEPKKLPLPKRENKRKRGTAIGKSTNKGIPNVSQARRTRARLGKKAAKIYENESDKSASSDEEMNKEEPLEIHGNEIVEDTESSHRGREAEQEVVEDDKQGEWFNEGKKPEKLEVMVDPVQAMLFDMIPSLGMKKVEIPDSVVEDKKSLVDRDLVVEEKKTPVDRDSVVVDKKPAAYGDLVVEDPNPVPVKKKKVSYRDLANKLLKG